MKRWYDMQLSYFFIPHNDYLQNLHNVEGISDLKRELARFQVKLEKKWGNEHDNTFVYIYPDGTKLPLTPHMLKEWARALVSHHSMITPHQILIEC
jgi:hypothetical protein